MKIVTIIGARPQFVKAAVVSRAIAQHPEIREVIVHTGQHFDPNMSDIFFEEMEIPRPDYNLDIHSLNHGAMTGKMLTEIEKILLTEQPDYVLVYGDTNSTLAGALAARKLHLQVVHVEAGLRSFNRDMPEEINRILTDRISDFLFCPTDAAVRNLQAEGFGQFPCHLFRSGDVMQDAALFYAPRARAPREALPERFVLATVHRAENTDCPEKLADIFQALETIARKNGMVLPLHPRTRQKLLAAGFDPDQSPIRFIPPVGYLEMVYLLKNCTLVMTDSGGVQKEAYFFRKYCLTLRTETEWAELTEQGCNQVCGTRPDDILKACESFLHRSTDNFPEGLYGDGHTGETIVKELLNAYVHGNRP